MGWMKKFLGLFLETDAEQTAVLEEVHLQDLPDWLYHLSQEITVKAKLEEHFNNYLHRLKDKRWLLECRLDEWDDKLLGRKSEELSVTFAEARKLLNSINIPERNTLKSVLKLNTIFAPNLEKLTHRLEQSSLMHNYAFLLNEEEKNSTINPLLKELLEITALKNDFEEKVALSGYGKVQSLLERITLIEKYTEKLKSLHEELEAKQARLKQAHSRQKDKAHKLGELQERAEYTSLQGSRSRKEELLRGLDDNDDKVFLFFSKIKPALKQHAQISGKPLVFDYLEKSMKVFYDDKRLLILDILRELKEDLINEFIKLGPEEKNETMTLIERAQSGYLQQLIKEHDRLLEEIAMVKNISGNKEFLLKVEDSQYRFSHFSKQVEKLRKEVQFVEEELKSVINLRERELEMFKNLAKVSLNKELQIIV